MAPNSFNGLLVIDKPAGITSRDVVNRVARWFPKGTRLGHTGTLDPLATGVLVVCVGVATRLAEYVQRMDKTYQASLLLGVRSDTDDADGRVQAVEGAPAPERARIAEALYSLVGSVLQVPPVYSAAKMTGRRAYALARRGKEVTLQARPVRIDRIDVIRFEYPRLDIEVECGKGTYIRAIARDLGEVLGCGALIKTLRRTRVGRFEVGAALELDVDEKFARNRLLPLAAAVGNLPVVTLTAEALAQLRQGKAVPAEDVPGNEGQEVAVFDETGNLSAIAQIQSDRLLQPTKVLF